jgi:hypothetical protein
LIYEFHEAIRTKLRGLHVDSQGISNVKQLLAQGKKVVLLPVYQSMFDIILH